MDNKNSSKKKKGSPIALVVVLAYVAITSVISEIGASGLSVLFPILFIIILVVIAAAVVSAKKKGVGASAVHSHDRIAKSPSNEFRLENCKGIEHWVTQLDGFLAAGIIDKNEYKVLLKSYRKNYDENGNYLY